MLPLKFEMEANNSWAIIKSSFTARNLKGYFRPVSGSSVVHSDFRAKFWNKQARELNKTPKQASVVD